MKIEADRGGWLRLVRDGALKVSKCSSPKMMVLNEYFNALRNSCDSESEVGGVEMFVSRLRRERFLLLKITH